MFLFWGLLRIFVIHQIILSSSLTSSLFLLHFQKSKSCNQKKKQSWPTRYSTQKLFHFSCYYQLDSHQYYDYFQSVEMRKLFKITNILYIVSGMYNVLGWIKFGINICLRLPMSSSFRKGRDVVYFDGTCCVKTCCVKTQKEWLD